jgi:hypothetical protein
MVDSGTSLLSIKKTFDREGIPTPSSGHPARGDGRFWSQAFLKKCIMQDAYKPHTPEELMELLPTDVADNLDADALPVLGGSNMNTLWSPSITTSWACSRRSSR